MGLHATVETALNEWLGALDAEAWDVVADWLDEDVQLADELTTEWLRGRDRVGAYLRASEGIVTDIVSTPSGVSVADLGPGSALATFSLHQRYRLDGEPRDEQSTGCAAFTVREGRLTLSLFHLAPVRTATQADADMPKDGRPEPAATPLPATPTAPEPFVLGDEIRRRRTDAGLSLRNLAERTGLSASFLSQIERSRADLSVSSLHQVAAGLGVDVAVLLGRGDDGASATLREGLAGQRSRFYVGEAGVTVEGFPGFDDGRIEAYIAEPASGQPARESAGAPGGEEFLYVLGGRIAIELEERSVLLEAGDGVHLRSAAPHRVSATGTARARYLVVQTRDRA
jgi:transcriptional regulator with XRE-family HTH domain